MEIVERMTLKGLIPGEWVGVCLMEDGSMSWIAANIRRVDERHMVSETTIFPNEVEVDRPGPA